MKMSEAITTYNTIPVWFGITSKLSCDTASISSNCYFGILCRFTLPLDPITGPWDPDQGHSWLCSPTMALGQVDASQISLHESRVLWTPPHRGRALSWLFMEVMHEDVERKGIRRQTSVWEQSHSGCEEMELMGRGWPEPGDWARLWPNRVVTDAGPPSLSRGI